MSTKLLGNIGGWIGRELANGNPLAVVGLVVVPLAFFAAYRLLIINRRS
jgi:hypothetical protein